MEEQPVVRAFPCPAAGVVGDLREEARVQGAVDEWSSPLTAALLRITVVALPVSTPAWHWHRALQPPTSTRRRPLLCPLPISFGPDCSSGAHPFTCLRPAHVGYCRLRDFVPPRFTIYDPPL